jgi:DNA-binding CsgD family transcriptional regulator
MKFAVLCQVSDGVTGRRTGFLRKDGRYRYFDSMKKAQAVANELNATRNGPHQTASFRYWPAQVTENFVFENRDCPCGSREDSWCEYDARRFASPLLSNLVQCLRTLGQKTFDLTSQELARSQPKFLLPRFVMRRLHQDLELEIRRSPEKGRTEGVAAVNSQPEPPDEKSNPLLLWLPPRDVHDQAAWDRYWQHRKGDRSEYCPAIYRRSRRDLTEREREVQQLLAEGKSEKEIASVLNLNPRMVAIHKHCIMQALHPEALHPPEDSLLIQCLIKRRAKTVLCAGNGVSQEPRALAAAGFDVTAMDLSPLAVHLAETWQFSSEELDSFCTKEERTPGGTVRFVIGDVLDRSVCPGPFDAIIERRMLQLFPEQEQGVALDALASRLKADGLLVSHRHNQLLAWPAIVRIYRDRGWSVLERPDHGGRGVWQIMSTG